MAEPNCTASTTPNATVRAKRSSKRTVVSPLQHGWLKAMGVDVPWIAANEPSADDRSADDRSAAVQRSTAPGLAASESPAIEHPPIEQPAGIEPQEHRAPAVRPKPAMPPVTSGSVASTAQKLPELDLNRLDLSQLAHTVLSCQRCGLCETRQQAVPGDGAQKPTILIVGEAPGEQEDMQGKPFVGRSGELLDNMLKAIGHGRQTSVFITNVVKCRPPANRNPRDDEIAACAPYLARQIELLEPKVILAMGRFAAHALLKSEAPLQKLRQTTHTFESAGQSLPLVVTYHPAYLLRRPVDKRLAWEDLKRLRALVGVGSVDVGSVGSDHDN